MSWRTVVISNSAKLDYQLGFLVVRQEMTTKIHMSEIHTILVESTAVSLTAALLNECVHHKIKVVFCDEKRNPSSELLPYYGAHDSSRKVRNQIEWSQDVKSAVWTEIVSEKIRKQQEVLHDYGHEQADMLARYLEEIQFADATNREGHAAKVYFNALFGMQFSRSEDNSINAALNYGYSIILSAFTREIAMNGYLTQLGLFHDNVFNPFNLASDLMEPFRPLVDRAVIELQPEVFDHDEKIQMIEVMNQTVVINTRKELVANAIKIYTKSIFDALEERDVSMIRFYNNEL